MRFTATYTQELTQALTSPSIDGAAAYAKRYAADNRLKLLQIYPETPKSLTPGLPAPPAA